MQCVAALLLAVLFTQKFRNTARAVTQSNIMQQLISIWDCHISLHIYIHDKIHCTLL